MSDAPALYRSNAVRGSRAGAGFIFSAIVHLAVLAALLLNLPKPAPLPLQPAMELTLVRPSAFPAPPRTRPTTTARAVAAPRIPRTTEPVPRSPLVADRSQPLVRPAPPALPAPTAADILQFFKKHVPGCGREDFILLSPEEQDRCLVRLAAAAAAERRGLQASDRNAPPITGLADDRRRAFEEQVEKRRRFRESPLGDPVAPCTGVGSNFGLGCLNTDDSKK